MFTSLLALGLIAALQVPGLAEDIMTTATEQQEIVDKHNALRRSVQPPASNMVKMSWSSEAAANAKKRANTCPLERSLPSDRVISTSDCGENVYMSNNKDSWSKAIQSWYDEIKNWNYGVWGMDRGPVEHFAQLALYRSNQVGCAMAYCPNAKYQYFYVCHYCPRGYYGTHTPYKSGPPCADCPRACDNGLCTNSCLYTDEYVQCPEMIKKQGCSVKEIALMCGASCKCANKIV